MSGIIKHCQLCGGPVVNGRCKLCGMPYRNDEELYHLNESRSDHYRHASRSERKTMEQQERALPDQRKEINRERALARSAAQQRAQASKRMTTPPRPQLNHPLDHTNPIPNVPRGTRPSYGRSGSLITWIIFLAVFLIVVGSESCRF